MSDVEWMESDQIVFYDGRILSDCMGLRTGDLLKSKFLFARLNCDLSLTQISR